jgi:predicted DNA-binding protein
MAKELDPTVSFRVPQDVLDRLDELAQEENTFRTDVLKTIITTHPMFASQSEGAAA